MTIAPPEATAPDAASSDTPSLDDRITSRRAALQQALASVPLDDARRRDLTQQLTVLEQTAAHYHSLASVESLEHWRDQLEAWRATLAAERLTIKSPIKDRAKKARA